MNATVLLLLAFTACNRGFVDPTRELADPVDRSKTWPTVVHEPTSYGVLQAPLVSDTEGRSIPAGTACVTCHGVNPDKSWKATPGDNFHKNITLQHGTLSCDQCHDQDRTRLHLADGTPVAFVEVMKLCAQCHGPQFRDYSHGAHGGMNGSWDLAQGPRIRNNCVDCHEPHAPLFKQVMPVLPPRDRYLETE